MACLMELKKSLHHGKEAIIETPFSMKLNEFMETYFPPAFYLDTFQGSDGKKCSLYNLLSGRGKGSISQRSRIFNGCYNGRRLAGDILTILTVKREIWQQICVNCAVQMRKADMPRLEALLKQAAKETGDSFFKAWVEQTLISAPEEAFAAVLIILLSNGSPRDFTAVFSGGKPLEEQLRYMDTALPMMKRTFHNIIHGTAFEGDMKETYEDYAALMKPVTTVHAEGKCIHYDHLLDELYLRLRTDARKLIRITGPAGCEKNAITQLLYLRLACEVRGRTVMELAPCYINLSHYRRQGFRSREALQAQLREDLAGFIEFCKNNTLRTPILFVDGVKNFSMEEDDLGGDYLLNDIIRRYLPKAKVVVATENSVLPNRSRQRPTPQFASGSFACQVNINSLHLPDKAVAKTYMEQFKRIYAWDLDYDIEEKLRSVFLDEVDTYQLRMVLPFLRDADNINTLYYTLCMDYLNGNSSELQAAALWAFHFSYTDRPLPEISPKVRDLLGAHNSFLDYFCARFYRDKLRAGTSQDDIDQLNMVLPRSVTRFITPLLNESESIESRVLSMTRKSFDYMGVFAKVQLCYWLGRIKSPTMSVDAGDLLKEYYDAHKRILKTAENRGGQAYLHQLFVYRSVGVSLLNQGRGDEISEDFLSELMENSRLNELNRAFHLHYYGDAPYLPVYDTLSPHDDPRLGKRTMDCLLAALERSRDTGILAPLFEFNLFTLCSLLQARMETHLEDQTFDPVTYLSQAKQYVEWYLGDPRLTNEELRSYLQMIHRDFRARLSARTNKWSHIAADSFAQYQTRVKRTGWVERDIPDCESVSEHTYNTWLLAKLLLPDSYPEEPEYSKAQILELILLHGLAEALNGDVSKPVRDLNPERYEALEEKEMGILFQRDTYPCLPSQLESGRIWRQWNNKKSFNGRLAHDLDLVQTMFQLLLYRSRYPEKIGDEDFSVWMGERNKLQTPLGFEVYQTVIQQNSSFAQVLAKL